MLNASAAARKRLVVAVTICLLLYWLSTLQSQIFLLQWLFKVCPQNFQNFFLFFFFYLGKPRYSAKFSRCSGGPLLFPYFTSSLQRDWFSLQSLQSTFSCCSCLAIVSLDFAAMANLWLFSDFWVHFPHCSEVETHCSGSPQPFLVGLACCSETFLCYNG